MCVCSLERKTRLLSRSIWANLSYISHCTYYVWTLVMYLAYGTAPVRTFYFSKWVFLLLLLLFKIEINRPVLQCVMEMWCCHGQWEWLQTADALNQEPSRLAGRGDPASGNDCYSITSATDFGKLHSFFGSFGTEISLCLFPQAISTCGVRTKPLSCSRTLTNNRPFFAHFSFSTLPAQPSLLSEVGSPFTF